MNYVVFSFSQPVLYVLNVEGVRNGRRGPASYNDPDHSSSDYQNAQQFFRTTGNHERDEVLNELNQIAPPNEGNIPLAILELPQPGDVFHNNDAPNNANQPVQTNTQPNPPFNHDDVKFVGQVRFESLEC